MGPLFLRLKLQEPRLDSTEWWYDKKVPRFASVNCMKFSAIPHISLLLVAWVPAAQATRPCSVGESEDDILVTIARMGFYRQDRDGVVPEARDHSVGGSGPSPFVVEVFEEGLTGFTAENSTFDGMVRFDWGQISFEEVALFWTGTSFGFDGENPLKAAVSSASPRFRFEDEDAAFDVTLPVATWDLPTPQVTNFRELQEIDPAKPVMLRWNPLVGNAAAETLLLQIREFTESAFRTVFTTTPCQIPFPVPGVAVMQSSATFFTLPANLLTNRIATYSAELSVSRFHGSRSGNFGACWRVDATDE